MGAEVVSVLVPLSVPLVEFQQKPRSASAEAGALKRTATTIAAIPATAPRPFRKMCCPSTITAATRGGFLRAAAAGRMRSFQEEAIFRARRDLTEANVRISDMPDRGASADSTSRREAVWLPIQFFRWTFDAIGDS
jgi:hypothetical protein